MAMSDFVPPPRTPSRHDDGADEAEEATTEQDMWDGWYWNDGCWYSYDGKKYVEWKPAGKKRSYGKNGSRQAKREATAKG